MTMTRSTWLHLALSAVLAGALPGCASAAKKKPADVRAAKAAREAKADAAAPTYAKREDALQFADALAARQGLDAAWVRAALGQARYIERVTRYIMPPPAGTAKNWALYRSRFIDDTRIAAGVAFWNRHAEWLRKAEAEYGVPPEIVVGIVGVETLYGRNTGDFRVLDSLATLAFDFPPGRRDRSDFFRDELEQLFVLSAREHRDPASFRGSYAGALGWPQFMPSSWNRYAVDFDGDGRVDLNGSIPDVIGSVAHYMAAFGWVRGMPTRYAVAAPVDTAERATLLAPDIRPTFTAAQFAEHGAELSDAGRLHEGLLALVELQNGDAAPTYVAGTSNFYTVTRYNWSAYYAMAVIELGEAVSQAAQR